MKESEIIEIINSNSIPELLNKIGKFYPKGFDIEKIDKRIKEKIRQLENKFAEYNNSIEDIRREGTYNK
jgi:hypothetical protein